MDAQENPSEEIQVKTESMCYQELIEFLKSVKDPRKISTRVTLGKPLERLNEMSEEEYQNSGNEYVVHYTPSNIRLERPEALH